MIRTSLLATCWSLALLGSGCAAKVGCPPVGGTFYPQYRPLSGSCGQIANVFPVDFTVGPNGNRMSIVGLGNTRVTTEIVMKGCTVRMTQMVETGIETSAAHVAAKIDGETLTIHSADTLSGNVMVTQFDDKGQPACNGMYDAQFSQTVNSVGGAAMPTVGGAAQH